MNNEIAPTDNPGFALDAEPPVATFNVTDNQNFARVFMLPREYPREYCFAGGHPVQMQLVDWFNPVPPPEMGLTFATEEELFDALEKQIKEKVYFRIDRTFLLLTNWGVAKVIGAPVAR